MAEIRYSSFKTDYSSVCMIDTGEMSANFCSFCLEEAIMKLCRVLQHPARNPPPDLVPEFWSGVHSWKMALVCALRKPSKTHIVEELLLL